MSGVPPGVFTDRWQPVGESVGTAVVLPGTGYPPAAPLLAYAGYALLAAGWVVQDVWWEPQRLEVEESIAWVAGHLASATEGVDDRVMVVGKSYGTLASRLAAERSYDAIWLTPLLSQPEVVEAIRGSAARQLLVGGTEDSLWDADVVASLAADGCDVLQVDGANHGMIVPGDAVRSAQILVEITRAMVRFVAG